LNFLSTVVIFSAGGTGAGKTTGLERLGEAGHRAQVIYDTNMSSVGSATRKIDQAIEAGKLVRVVYTYRDPVEALTKGALPRAMRQEAEHGTGRTVPLSDHATTHEGSRNTATALIERYKDDPRVRFTIIDNSRGKGQSRVVPSIEDLPARDYNSVREELRTALEDEYSAGRISEAVYRGFRGADQEVPRGLEEIRPGSGRQPQSRGPREQVTAADRAAVADPQTREAALRGAVANDLNGDPVNVEPLFELDAATRTKPIEQTLDQLRRGDSLPAQAVDEIIEAADEPAVTEQLAELEQSIKDFEREITLDESTLPEDIRAEIDEARALEQEAGTFAETARMISACAMRASI